MEDFLAACQELLTNRLPPGLMIESGSGHPRCKTRAAHCANSGPPCFLPAGLRLKGCRPLRVRDERTRRIQGRDHGRDGLPLRWAFIIVVGVASGLGAGSLWDPSIGVAAGLGVTTLLHQTLS